MLIREKVTVIVAVGNFAGNSVRSNYSVRRNSVRRQIPVRRNSGFLQTQLVEILVVVVVDLSTEKKIIVGTNRDFVKFVILLNLVT